MGDKWHTAKVGEIAEKVAMGPFGSSIKVSTFIDEGIPIISGKHLHGIKLEDSEFNFISYDHAERLKNANVYRGDIVFTHAGNIGQVAYIPESSKYKKYILSQRQFYMRCTRRKVLPEFVTYFFKTPEGQHRLLANTSQTGVPSIAQPVSYLKTIEIPLPPLPEQKAIASILGALDDKIELNRKMNETLEAMAMAIFKSWFTYPFEGVKGIPSPLPSPTGRGCQELTGEGELQLVDSPLGKIPKGWRVGTLGELVDFINERVETTPEKDKEKYIALDDMPHRSINLAQYRAGIEVNSSIIRFREGDILFGAMRPYFHKVGLTQFDGITRTTTFVLRPKKPIGCLFALMNFFSDAVIEYATNASVGSTIPYIKWDALSIFQIIMPNEDLIKKYNDFTMPMIHQIKINSKQSHTLASIRDALLPKLLSGEVRVKDVERFIEGKIES